MRRKGFTLVELLVVIGIIAVLMGVLLPALNAVKRTAQRVVCGTNLSGLGRAILLYANDHGGEYPRAGGPGSVWDDDGYIDNWDAKAGGKRGPWKLPPGADVTITSSLYLLIKYADVTPGQFVCKGDVGTKEFKLSDAKSLLEEIDDLTDVWDFGEPADLTTGMWPGQYNSYAYHDPYGDGQDDSVMGYPLGSYSNPACPMAADRNPYLDKNAVVYLEGGAEGSGDPDEVAPSWNDEDFYDDPDRTGNAAAHQREGQNVLFNDSHVKFERYPNVGITKDNIWKCWVAGQDPPDSPEEREVGVSPYNGILTDDGIGASAGESDAYLVSENNQEL